MDGNTIVDFTQLNAKDVLLEDAIAEYRHGMDSFYLEQLVPLNARIYILERIVEFPLGLFAVPEDMIFFALVRQSFFESGLITITRLATDSAPDLYTLTRFKNWVLEHIRPEYKKAFQMRLRQARFDAEVRAMLKEAKRLRDARIAHIKRNESETGYHLGLAELKSLRDALNGLLDLLSFNVEHLMLPSQYSPEVRHPVGTDHRSDIERILDCIARDSALLNYPEQHPGRWSSRRRRLSEQDIETLNEYRTKFGLPVV